MLNRFVEFFIIIFSLIFISESYAEILEGCTEKNMSPPAFFYKVKDPKQRGNWTYSAEIGDLENCKKSLTGNKVKVNDFAIVSKKEFCNIKNRFFKKDDFWLSLGEHGLELCENYSLNSNIVPALIKLRHDAQNPNTSYGQLGEYLDERDRLIDDLISGKQLEADSKTADSTKEKLHKLKELLSEGLITQDQYDKKSDEILKGF